MKRIICFLLGIQLSLCAQEQPAEPTTPPVNFVNPSDQGHFQLLIQGMNQWAFDLYKHLSRQPGNFCASPFSIAANLVMVGNGAKQATSTAIQQLLHYPAGLNLLVGDLNLLLLGVPTTPKNAAQLLSANAIWIQKGIPLLVSFQQVIQRDFQISIGIVNFEQEAFKAVQTINEWGAKQTKNKINQIISPQDVGRQTHLVLTSGVYLQGQWVEPFNSSLTKRDIFYMTPEHSSMLPFMVQTGQKMYNKGDKWESVTLPYVSGDKGGQFMMTFLIPATPTDLKVVENSLTQELWLDLKKNARLTPLNLYVPRFRVEDRLELGRVLPEMGLKIAFTPEADFSGISTTEKLFINTATHRAIYRVDEKGSDASSSLYQRIADQKPIENETTAQELRLNRPFIFVVWEMKSQAIVFVGRIMQP
jgi:serpin B